MSEFGRKGDRSPYEGGYQCASDYLSGFSDQVGKLVEAGQLQTQLDELGRVRLIEGWCKRSNGYRDGTELRYQAALQAGAEEGYDASHLIPHILGGRGAENLVLMPERINRSHVRAIEKELCRLESESADPRGIYVRVTVAWGDDGSVPLAVRHEAYERNEADGLRKIHDSETVIARVPEKTLKGELEGFGQNTSEWASNQRPNGWKH